MEGSMRGGEGGMRGGEWKGDKMRPNSNIFFLTAGFYVKPLPPPKGQRGRKCQKV